nr:hypothetical protein [Hufsiella arboris]
MAGVKDDLRTANRRGSNLFFGVETVAAQADAKVAELAYPDNLTVCKVIQNYIHQCIKHGANIGSAYSADLFNRFSQANDVFLSAGDGCRIILFVSAAGYSGFWALCNVEFTAIIGVLVLNVQD